MELLRRFNRTRTGQALFAWELAHYLRLIHRTTRWQVDRPPAAAAVIDGADPFIACFWHGRLATMRRAWLRDPKSFHILISGHRDGTLIARAIERLGFATIWGSSRRGGTAALRTIRQTIDRGHCIGITPDGPRGPRMRAKIGAIKAAQISGVPILPVSGAVAGGRILKTWDRTYLPSPFRKGVILYGDPITVPRQADRAALERHRLELERSLNALTAEADRRCGHPIIEPAPESAQAGSEAEAESAATSSARSIRHAGA